MINVTGVSPEGDAVAVSVPLPLSTTSTVTVLPDVAAASFVTPATLPASVTVYVYLPGFVYSIGPNVTIPPSLSGLG